ncbi:MAG TPA: MBL fold metallo-hydrolase [Thermoanaerobaculia bacterium]|nr:MBL fold metallo-hydrolase [Thermoanaerobaculia bacterium]
MRVAVLGSGSQGNAVVVEAGGKRLLLDAGFSCREIEKRLARVGVAAESLAGVVVTHEHRDHVRGADRLARRWRLPIYATGGTLEHAHGLSDAARRQTRTLASGVPVEVDGFVVEPFAIPHDAAEPVGLVVTAPDGCRLGLAGDLGSRSRLAWARLAELDVLLLETNHDLDMLRSGPYPWVLKQRIASRHGHLSNRDAADGLAELLCDRLRWVVCYHLSQTNNLPHLAAEEVVRALDREGSPAAVAIGDQDTPSEWIEVAPPTVAALAESAAALADRPVLPFAAAGSPAPAVEVAARRRRAVFRRRPPRQEPPTLQLGLDFAFGGEG